MNKGAFKKIVEQLMEMDLDPIQKRVVVAVLNGKSNVKIEFQSIKDSVIEEWEKSQFNVSVEIRYSSYEIVTFDWNKHAENSPTKKGQGFVLK